MMKFVAVTTILASLVGLSAPSSSSPAGPSSVVEEWEFHRNEYQIRDLPRERWPYVTSAAGPLDGSNTFDEEGVSVRVIRGQAYDHPVLQAQFMLTRLNSYSHNADPDYLVRVRAHADRLIENAVLARGAMYLPYPFDWALHGDPSDMINAPWYSAMAQGQALSAFVRLYEVTGEDQYREAADLLFASFLNLKETGSPWTVNIDDDGFLWFEEYAKDVGADRSVNGHIFATYGLYDYFRLTNSPTAQLLFQGGVTAIAGHMDSIRNPGWISRYSLENQEYMYASYHTVHVGQLYQLYNMTGDPALARAADLMLEDYPASQHGGRGYIGAGTHHTLEMDGSTAVGLSETIVPTAEAVTLTGRQRIAGQPGIWLRVANGTLADTWARETPGHAFVKLGTERYVFDPVRLVRFERGTYTGYTFNNLGLPAAAKRFTLTSNSAAHAGERVVMNGVTYFRIVDGVWRGYWIPAGNGVTIR